MNTSSLPFRLTAGLLSLVMLCLPLQHGWAQATSQAAAGRQGQAFGELIQPGAEEAGSLSGGVLTLPGAGVSVPLEALFPGGGAGANALFPHAQSAEQLQGYADNGPAMGGLGSAVLGDLRSDSASSQPSLQGQVFEIVQGARQVPKLDMRDDPMWRQSQQIYAASDAASGAFEDCDAGTDPTGHTPALRQCTRVTLPGGQCSAVHAYQVGILTHHAGPMNLNSCGADCLQLWIGEVGDNYWNGNCTVYEQATEVRVSNPQAITSAVLEYAKWDDYMQVYVGAEGQEQLIWAGPNGNFPPESAGACELSTSWETNPGVDVTHLFRSQAADTVVRFKIRVSVTGSGEGFGRIRLHYDPSLAVADQGWAPLDCLGRAVEASRFYNQVRYTCTQMPALDADGCLSSGGVRACPDAFAPTGMPGISPLCRAVSVSIDAGQYHGEYGDSCAALDSDPQCGFVRSTCVESAPSGECVRYTDVYDCAQAPDSVACRVQSMLPEAFNACQPQTVLTPHTAAVKGNDYRTCERISGQDASNCTALEQNPACQWVRSRCTDGTAHPDGGCGVSTEEYNCGALSEVTRYRMDTTYDCPSSVSCMGSACMDIHREASQEFGQATALLHAAQHVGQDMTCTAPTGTENVFCEVFKAVPGECKKALGGTVDCCEKPSNVSTVDYLALVLAMPKIDAAMMGVEASGAMASIQSGYAALRNPVVGSFETVTQPFTSFVDGVTAFTDKAIEQIKQELREQLSTLFQNAMGTAAETGVGAGGAAGVAGDQAAGAVTDGAASSLVQGATSVMGTLMAVYAYYVIAMLVVQMIWECEEEEFTMNAQRVLGNCHYVGSYCADEVLGACIEKREGYCCFNSPLSRIIQEQARPQLGKSWGTAEEPQCGGLTLDDIAALDWTRIDLSEWTALLNVHGLLHTPENVTLEGLTGAGNILNTDGARENSVERTERVTREVDLSGAARRNTELMSAPPVR